MPLGGCSRKLRHLAKAYDHATLSLLRSALDRRGTPTQLVNCVIRCNTKRKVSFAAPRPTTDGFVWIGKGLTPRGSCSPILFLAVLEEVLKPFLESLQDAHVSWCSLLPTMCTCSGRLLYIQNLMTEFIRYLEASHLWLKPEMCSLGGHHAR